MKEVTVLRIFIGFFGFIELVPGVIIAGALCGSGNVRSLRVENLSASRISVAVDHEPLVEQMNPSAVAEQSLSSHRRVGSISVTRDSIPQTGIVMEFPQSVSARGVAVTVRDLSGLPAVPTPVNTPASPPNAPPSPSRAPP